MNYKLPIKPGDVLDNKYLYKIFQCGARGGMRRSLATNSLVLIFDHTKELYKDNWEDGFLLYTGMGLYNDQSIEYMQNKTLAESNNNGVNIVLFEVFHKGHVKLIREPYQADQLDAADNMRKV
jgi:5-methylcytosine-specific restriction protein A